MGRPVLSILALAAFLASISPSAAQPQPGSGLNSPAFAETAPAKA